MWQVKGLWMEINASDYRLYIKVQIAVPISEEVVYARGKLHMKIYTE